MQVAPFQDTGIADQRDKLNRLYDLKCQQLRRAGNCADSLLYRVLTAEAEAISEALKLRQETP